MIIENICVEKKQRICTKTKWYNSETFQTSCREGGEAMNICRQIRGCEGRVWNAGQVQCDGKRLVRAVKG